MKHIIHIHISMLPYAPWRRQLSIIKSMLLKSIINSTRKETTYWRLISVRVAHSLRNSIRVAESCQMLHIHSKNAAPAQHSAEEQQMLFATCLVRIMILSKKCQMQMMLLTSINWLTSVKQQQV